MQRRVPAWLPALCLLGCSDEDDTLEDSSGPEWCQPGSGELLLNELAGKGNAVELWNRGSAPIDVSGYTLATTVGTKGGSTTLPAGSVVPAGGPLALPDLDTGLRLFAASTLTLSDTAGGPIDCTSFSTVDVWTSWCRIPDGTGPWARCSSTLGLLNQPEPAGSDGTDGTEAGDGTDGSDGTDGTDGLDGSDATDGSDGLDGVVPNAEIVLNELDGPNKTIELTNRGSAEQPLAGFRIESEETGSVFVFTSGSVPPGEFVMLDLKTVTLDVADEDRITLKRPDGVVADEVSLCDGISKPAYGRFPDGWGPLYALPSATPGAANASPTVNGLVAIPDVVITGKPGEGPGEYDAVGLDEVPGPGKVLITTDERVWVTDPANARVHVYEATGAYVTTLSGFGEPIAFGMGFKDEAFIVDAASNEILVYDSPTLTLLRTIVLEDIGRPTGLAIEPDGTMYVVDQSIGVLFHLDAEGKLLRRLDPELVSANYLYDPMDIVVDRDRDQLFVVSADGGKVYVFGLTSGLLRKDVYVGYKPEGTPDADGSFELRCGGAAAFLGPRILFLVDWDYGRVMLHDLVVGDDLFNPAKKYGFFASIGRPGDGCGELDGPWAIAACEAADLIAVSDPYNFRVQLFKVSKLLELIEKFE
jgi:DNA-binding beta-propeller fold protein YncE